ncbi:hypothetical protein HY095_06020 [Candidatus Micrarchaeota archaeon]|nr:hypothetical protein [Candidatus Micrarchaeota archaeon]
MITMRTQLVLIAALLVLAMMPMALASQFINGPMSVENAKADFSGCGHNAMCFKINTNKVFTFSIFAYDSNNGELYRDTARIPQGNNGKAIAINRQFAYEKLSGKEAHYLVTAQGDDGVNEITRTLDKDLLKVSKNSGKTTNVFEGCDAKQRLGTLVQQYRRIPVGNTFCFYFLDPNHDFTEGKLWKVTNMEIVSPPFARTKALVQVKFARIISSEGPAVLSLQAPGLLPAPVSQDKSNIVYNPLPGLGIQQKEPIFSGDKETGCMWIRNIHVRWGLLDMTIEPKAC